jgi:IS605 OrfB family transposase
MSKRTIKCRMHPSPVNAESLSVTCKAFAAACNAVLAVATERNIYNAVKLHHACYRLAREEFSLSANLAVRAVRRVAAAMTACRKRKIKPKVFRPSSIDYDARIFDYRERDETVSLTVVGGRIHVPLLLGRYQREALTGKRPTAATVVKIKKRWDIHIVVEDIDADPVSGPPMGVDLGIRNTAATSNGALHNGTVRQQFKAQRSKVRASLQSKGTKGAKRVLARLSGYENRRIKHENHELSKQIVSEAQRHGCGVIRMEQLRAIRERTRTWNKHLNRMVAGWSFGQLKEFISYKAKRAGIAVELVNPAYTSQTCHRCGLLGTRNRDSFSCTTCGYFHADINAAWNIAGGGVVGRPELRACS